jgi:hypothetical protein
MAVACAPQQAEWQFIFAANLAISPWNHAALKVDHPLVLYMKIVTHNAARRYRQRIELRGEFHVHDVCT